MIAGERSRRRRQPFAAWLDDEVLSRRAKIFLVAIAVALAWAWLPGLTFVFLQPARGWDREALARAPWPHLPNLLADGVIAFAVGLLSGRAGGRHRWLLGAAIIAALAAVHVLLALPFLGRPVGGIPGPARLSLGLAPRGAAYLGGLLILAGLGGVLSPTISRRLEVSAVVSVALAWVGGQLLRVGVVLTCFMGLGPQDVSYASWSFTCLVMFACEHLPYFAGGLWMGWARRGRPWVAAMVMGAMAVFEAARGQCRFMAPELAAVASEYAAMILSRTVVAAVGGWLGGFAAGARSRRELLTPVIPIIGAGVAAALLGSLAESRGTGISAAVQPPVDNGQIVLLAEGRAIGAVILTEQSVEPERVSYRWHYRTDGGGTFRSREAARYRSGEVSDATHIGFGPFSVAWSGHAPGSGYLYYHHFPGDPVGPGDLRICVTEERDLEEIDAFDDRWVFRASPSDPGAPLSRPGQPKALPLR